MNITATPIVALALAGFAGLVTALSASATTNLQPMLGEGEAHSAAQASQTDPSAAATPIAFDVYSGAPGRGNFLSATTNTGGPGLANGLPAGIAYAEFVPGEIHANNDRLGGISVTAVTEPARWLMLTLGVCALGATLRHRRRARALIPTRAAGLD